VNRRLAILDLSQGGHQPLTDESQRTWLVYNGEIYNFMELRHELLSHGHKFTSSSDTEVLLKAYLEWGPDCLSRLNGMFAFALWDGNQNRLFCARDRLGVKPFYFWQNSDEFVFASNLAALLSVPAVRRSTTINDGLVYDYLRWGWLDHSDETFFHPIKKLPPGSTLYLTCGQAGLQTSVQSWWDPAERNETQLSDRESEELVRSLLTDSVRLRLRSDVDVASCLSGGLDSSSIVALASREREPVGSPLQTFTIATDVQAYNERPYAEQVIHATGSIGNFCYPASRNFWADLPAVTAAQEEPFGGASVYGQWLLMQHISSRGIKVVLDGQGADELFCGYTKFLYLHLAQLVRTTQIITALREAGSLIRNRNTDLLNMSAGRRYLPAPLQRFLSSNEASLLAPALRDSHQDRVSIPSSYTESLRQYQIRDITTTSLPVLLRYEDKNSMSWSVESRLPFLDYRLVESAIALPANQKIRNGTTKSVLRRSVSDLVPSQVVHRRTKLGFVVPDSDIITSHPVAEFFESHGWRSRQYCDLPTLRSLVQGADRLGAGQRQLLFRALSLESWLDWRTTMLGAT
jgi:asparagine synthase (glutamine-hydrolysing)